MRQGDDDHRGSVQIYPESYLVKLFEKADLSTLLHETGHVFFEESEIAASRGIASEATQGTDGQLFQDETVTESKVWQQNLQRDVESWEKTVDDIAQNGLPKNDVQMLSQTPLIMDLLDSDQKGGKKSAKGGIYASPHFFDNTCIDPPLESRHF